MYSTLDTPKHRKRRKGQAMKTVGVVKILRHVYNGDRSG